MLKYRKNSGKMPSGLYSNFTISEWSLLWQKTKKCHDHHTISFLWADKKTFSSFPCIVLTGRNTWLNSANENMSRSDVSLPGQSTNLWCYLYLSLSLETICHCGSFKIWRKHQNMKEAWNPELLGGIMNHLCQTSSEQKLNF